MTLEEILKKANNYIKDDLNKKHSLFWLLLELLSISPTEYYLNKDKEVDEKTKNEYFYLVDKYLNENIPVQYLIGHSYFYNEKFYVNENTLIPRAETELLVEKTIKLIKKYFGNQGIDVLDLATGSGCIGITVKKILQEQISMTLADISKEALKVAKKNIKKSNLNITTIQSDWFSNINDKYDVIISNPPYVETTYIVDEVVDKEPGIALYGGKDGLDHYRIIIENSKKYLKDKAIIAFEHGYNQKDALKKIIEKQFDDAKIIQEKDLAGKDRYTFIIIGV